jgi:hypothetical protein
MRDLHISHFTHHAFLAIRFFPFLRLSPVSRWPSSEPNPNRPGASPAWPSLQRRKTVNRQTWYRFLLVGLLLALLAVSVLGMVAQPGVAGAVSGDWGHFITLQGKGTSAGLPAAGPATAIACTPPSSGNNCGGG